MSKFCYISIVSDWGNNAGSKAKNDVEKIFADLGMHKLNTEPLVSSVDNSGICYKLKSYIAVMKLRSKLKRLSGKIVFIQYPVLKYSYLKKALAKLALNNKIVYVIHDVDVLRKDYDEININEEITKIDLATVIVSHNSRMSELLIEHGISKEKLYNLDVFDYLAEVNDKKRLKTDGVAFAGNLVKSPFLKKYAGLKSAARLNLYGAAWDGESSGNIEYKGGYAPEKLVSEINGGFGLVWDGEEYDTCSGSTGKYLSYNNPHKMSLYIISGMPIITWSKAAIADFVQKNDIGITVDSLVDIKEKIDTLSDEKYDVMRKNVFEIAKRLSKGQQLKTIIEKIISEYTADEI